MLIKIAARELEINRKLYTFVLIHLYITFFIIMSFVSMMGAEYKRYAAFENYMKQDGWYLYLFDIFTPDNRGIQGSDMLEDYLKSADVAAGYTLVGELHCDGGVISAQPLVYDSDILKAYEPDMESGRWLRSEDRDTNEIEAVIASNDMGFETGDTIMLHGYHKLEKDPLEVRIVGVLKEDAYVPDLSFHNDGINYQNFYRPANEEALFVVMDYEDIISTEKQKIGEDELLRLSGHTFVTYRQEITDEEKEYNIEFLSAYGEINQREELPSVFTKSKEALKRKLKQFAPAVLLGLTLTVMNSLCVGIIISQKQCRNLSVYHMLGLCWRRCIRIQTMSYLLITGEAFFLILLTCLLVYVLRLDIYIQFGVWQALGCLAVTAVCVGIMALQKLLIVKKKPYILWRDAQE